MNLMLKYSKLNLAFLLLLNFVLIYITGHFLLTEQFFERNSNPLAGTPEEALQVYKSLQLWIYPIVALYTLLKIFAVSLILFTALYLKDAEVSFRTICKVVVLAEFIFIVPAVIKVATFPILFPGGSLSDWQQYFILSAGSLFKYSAADWSYALQTLNLFEVAYWFILAFGIQKITGFDFDRSLQLVLISYLPALFIWVATVTFFMLMIFPAFS